MAKDLVNKLALAPIISIFYDADTKDDKEFLEDHSFFKFCYLACFSVGVLIIIFLTIFSILSQSDKAGAENAKIYVGNIEAGKYKMNEITLKDTPELYIAYPIVCNSSECAYYANSEAQIIRKSEILNQKITLNGHK